MQSPSTPSTRPLYKEDVGSDPWPDERFLDERVQAATEGNLTAQTFLEAVAVRCYNSCHRRVRTKAWVLHADADEYALPSVPSESLRDMLRRQPSNAYAMPSIFASCEGRTTV